MVAHFKGQNDWYSNIKFKNDMKLIGFNYFKEGKIPLQKIMSFNIQS